MAVSNLVTASGGKTVKGQVFTTNGNWTAPTGVNFVTVYAVAGGGGAGEGRGNQNVGGNANSGASGGSTTFGANLLIAPGGQGANGGAAANWTVGGINANANSGNGGIAPFTGASPAPAGSGGRDAIPKEGTVGVSPGTSYAIAIGAGGAGGAGGGGGCVAGGNGGSGWLSLEWEE